MQSIRQLLHKLFISSSVTQSHCHITAGFEEKKKASYSLDDACTEGTSSAKEPPLPFVTSVFSSTLELTLEDHFYMLKDSATRALRCGYLLFLPSSPLLTLSFLFYK